MKTFKPNRASSKSFSERKRNRKNQELYNEKWTRYRFRFLHHNPFCYACGNNATDVDHIIAHKGDPEKFWMRANYLPLCKPCHSYVTAKFDRHIEPKTEEKCEWLMNRRRLFNIKRSVKVVPFEH